MNVKHLNFKCSECIETDYYKYEKTRYLFCVLCTSPMVNKISRWLSYFVHYFTTFNFPLFLEIRSVEFIDRSVIRNPFTDFSHTNKCFKPVSSRIAYEWHNKFI